jgi:hypothetical protein
MPSHDSTIIVDLGLYSSFTLIIDTSTLGVNQNFENSLPSTSVTKIETMTTRIIKYDIIQIHEDLGNLQNKVSMEEISTIDIPPIDNMHCMIESEECVKIVHNLAQIIGKLI